MSYSHSSELLYIHVCVYCRSCLSYSIYNLYQFVVWVEYDWTGSIHFPATRHPSRHPSCLQSLSVSPMTTGLEAHLPVGFHSRSSKPALAVCDSVRLLKSKKNFVDFLNPLKNHMIYMQKIKYSVCKTWQVLLFLHQLTTVTSVVGPSKRRVDRVESKHVSHCFQSGIRRYQIYQTRFHQKTGKICFL